MAAKRGVPPAHSAAAAAGGTPVARVAAELPSSLVDRLDALAAAWSERDGRSWGRGVTALELLRRARKARRRARLDDGAGEPAERVRVTWPLPVDLVAWLDEEAGRLSAAMPVRWSRAAVIALHLRDQLRRA